MAKAGLRDGQQGARPAASVERVVPLGERHFNLRRITAWPAASTPCI